ncbi:MAG: beta strand repeat-containing protein, partial [Bacteroidia bacterium]
MKQAYLIVVFLLNLTAGLVAQAPSFSITPSGSQSVCAGSTINLSSTVTNAFAGTTSYAVSDIPFAPYPMPAGTSVTMPDDTVMGPYPIGFQFCFFGNTYTQFYIGSNGWIGFTPGMTRAFTANPIPSNNMFVPRNCIMGPWMDFNPGISGGPYIKYQTQGIAPYRRLVVQWLNVPLYQCIAIKSTFQIVIYESTNIIENHITSKPTCMAWAGGTSTQGLHNLAGNQAVAVAGRNASVWTANNDGKRYNPNGPGSYTVNWTSNGIPIGSGNTISTTINGPGLTRLIGRVTFQCSNLALSDTLDVSIGGAASAAFSVPSTVCVGQPASFTYTGGAAGTGAWTFGSGTPNTATGLSTQSTTWNAAGTYPVTLTVTPSNAGCSPGTLTQNVVVTAPPTSTFSLPATACVNSNSVISYTGNAPAGATYSWDFGLGASPATASTVGPHNVSWSSAGSKTITLTVTSGSCTSTSTNTITVNAAPVASFSVNPLAVCAQSNTSVTFTGSAAAGATYTYSFGLGATPLSATGVGPHTVSWGSAGTKTVGLTVTSAGCTASSTQNVTVLPLPVASFSIPSSVCTGSSATLSYTGTAAAPPAATYAWSIDGATSAPGNTQGPFALSWTTAGVKTVGLTVTQNGCSSTTNQTITVNPTPSVSIAASAASACEGSPISLSVSGSAPAAGSSYSWNFGASASPASSSSSAPVSVTYNAAGSYSPSLTVTTNGCTSTPATTPITVSAPPTPAISIPASSCAGSPVSVSASGAYAAGTTFNWNFGSATVLSGSGAGPYSLQWNTQGNYSVTLTVNSGVCSASTSAAITIGAAPVASIVVPATVCEGQSATISFNGSAGAGSTYSWNFGAGASSSTASTVGPHSITWSTAGVKTISLSVTQGSCPVATVTQNITVLPVYTSSFVVPATVCAGQSASVSYSGNAPAGATYSWNFGSGATPATASALGPHNVVWSNSSNPTITLNVSSAGCNSAPTSQTVAIQPIPSAQFNLAASACTGSAVNVTYTGNAATTATYQWTFNGATPATANGQGPHAMVWNAAGNPSVSLTVVENGCSSAANTQSITVSNPPLVSVTANSTACVNQSVTVALSGNSLATASYTWNFGPGATPSTANGVGPHNVVYATAGVKAPSVQIIQNACSVNASGTITVNAIPSASFAVNSPACEDALVTAVYNGTASTSANYSWSYTGASLVNQPAASQIEVSYPNSGTYALALTVTENGCSSAANSQSVTVNALPVVSITTTSAALANMPVNVAIDQPQIAGATYTWNFSGATVISGSGYGPYVLQWPAAGNYTVSCELSAAVCAAVSATASVSILDAPVVEFTLPAAACAGEQVAVNYTGTVLPGAQFNWNFDGATVLSGSGVGPYLIEWPNAGTYLVSVTVAQMGATATVSHTIVVNSIPSASFSLPETACSNTAVTATFSGINNATQFDWSFAGATSASATGTATQSLSWSNAGVYVVSLTTEENGCISEPASQSILILETPSAAVEIPSTACSGEDVVVDFNGTESSNVSYSWDFGGGDWVSGSANGPFAVNFSQAGSYNVSVQVTQNGCTSPLAQANITVNQAPFAQITLNGNVCAGAPVEVLFTGTADADATFNWNFNNANVLSGSGAGPYTVVFANAGLEAISVEVSQNGCVASVTKSGIPVQALPVASFNLVDTTYTGIATEAVFTGTASPNNTYLWSYPTADLLGAAAEETIDLAWNTTGTFGVTLQVENSNCVSLPAIQQIVVLDFPIPSFSVENDTACVDAPVMISYTGGAASESAFQWNFDGAAIQSGSGMGPYQLSWNTPGVKTVSVSLIIDGIQTQTIIQEVLILDVPMAQFEMAQTVCSGSEIQVTYTASTGINSQFQWDFEGAQIVSGALSGSPVVQWDSAGVFTVSLSVADAMCISAPVLATIQVNPTPVIDVEFDSLVCLAAETQVTFIGTAGTGASFSWNF